MNQGQNIVIDNTNPMKEDRKKYIELAKEYHYSVRGYFFQSKLKDCIKRNNLREGKAKVPAFVVACTSNKLQIPLFTEGFDELYFVSFKDGIQEVEAWRSVE